MSVPAWPVSLPVAPRVAGLQETAPALTVRTQMDVGPAKVRKRTTFNVARFDLSMVMTGAQLGTFIGFYTGAAGGGAIAFQFKNPRSGVNGLFRFTSEPTWRPTAPRDDGAEYWEVAFSVEEVPSGSVEIEPPPPPPDWTTLIGTTGTHTFSHSSTLAAALTSCCFAAGDFNNFVTVNRTFAYARTTFSGLTPVSVVWEYTASGRTSSITYSRDGGWSYVLDAAHFGTTTCSGSTPFRPTANSESGGFGTMRHLGLPEIVGGGTGAADPAQFCPGANTVTQDWFRTVYALLTNGPLAAPAARATGFRDYAALCRTTVTGGGGPIITDSQTGGNVDTNTGTVPG